MGHTIIDKPKRVGDDGFTLIEMLITCGILVAMMTAFVGYMYQQSKTGANLQKHRNELLIENGIQTAIRSPDTVSSTEETEFEDRGKSEGEEKWNTYNSEEAAAGI